MLNRHKGWNELFSSVSLKSTHKTDIKSYIQDDLDSIQARRTAFLARFIVLREGKRSRAHRFIEKQCWSERTTAEELCDLFRAIFKNNGDQMDLVERDLRRALKHAHTSVAFFLREYSQRATLNFASALLDYELSNELVFSSDQKSPRVNGWRRARDLLKEI
ncbi:MAG TPA: hypothetical protein PKA79_06000 [Oligoflexia bacterium]|nr:hypothetical protein [Oligoflexia bacterium]